jgi:hypothetical protein
MIFLNLNCNNKNPQQKQQPTAIEREREREREFSSNCRTLKRHHLLSRAIISSQKPSSLLKRTISCPLEERGVEVRFRLVESASFKFFFFFSSSFQESILGKGRTKEKKEKEKSSGFQR